MVIHLSIPIPSASSPSYIEICGCRAHTTPNLYRVYIRVCNVSQRRNALMQSFSLFHLMHSFSHSSLTHRKFPIVCQHACVCVRVDAFWAHSLVCLIRFFIVRMHLRPMTDIIVFLFGRCILHICIALNSTLSKQLSIASLISSLVASLCIPFRQNFSASWVVCARYLCMYNCTMYI